MRARRPATTQMTWFLCLTQSVAVGYNRRTADVKACPLYRLVVITALLLPATVALWLCVPRQAHAPFGLVLKKFRRNWLDYGWWITLKRTLAGTVLFPFFER